MAVCDLCKGTGRLLKPWYDTTGLMTGFTGDICFKCDGKGTIVESLTNEEHIQTCNTVQLADVLWEQINGAFNSGYACCNLKQDKDYVGRYKRFIEWLKQPHSEVEK